MKRALIAMVVLAAVGGAGGGGFLLWQKHRLDAFAAGRFGDAATKVVEIPAKSGPRSVASLLARAGVVGDEELFYRFVRREELGPKLRAGEYEFEGPLLPAEVAQKVVAGQVKVYRFTIPEGLREDEILPLVAQSELKLDLGKLQALAKDPAFVRKAGVPADRLEGFLYPDTYSFPRGATEAQVLQKMVARSLEEYRKAAAQTKAGVTLDLLQTVTLASIIEKETGAPPERPRISCVFHNRLKQRMKLQTDPTVIYAMMLLRGTYSKNITRKDLETPHPYSTYTAFGLPPGPIANPGALALQAALNPLECDDLYFVSRNDGTHIFCPTYDCHLKAVEEWQVRFFREKRGNPQ